MAKGKKSAAENRLIPKRRRARAKSMRMRAEEDRTNYTDQDIRRAHRFVADTLIHRIHAAEARRCGDPTISPRDYHCGCAPSDLDFGPVCKGRKAGCRYFGRRRATSRSAASIDAAMRRFNKNLEKAAPRLRWRDAGDH